MKTELEEMKTDLTNAMQKMQTAKSRSESW